MMPQAVLIVFPVPLQCSPADDLERQNNHANYKPTPSNTSDINSALLLVSLKRPTNQMTPSRYMAKDKVAVLDPLPGCSYLHCCLIV